jgi:hypothetical protein
MFLRASHWSRGKFNQSECSYIADHRLLDKLFPVNQADDVYIKAVDIQSLRSKLTHSFLYLIRLPFSSSPQHIASAAANAKTLFLSLRERVEECSSNKKLPQKLENMASFLADPKAALSAVKAMRKTVASASVSS